MPRLPHRNLEMAALRPEPEPTLLYDAQKYKQTPPDYETGFFQYFSIAQPAAGQGFTRRVPTGFWEELKLMTFEFDTSAVAGNRGVRLEIIDDQSNVIGAIPQPTTQGANNNFIYTYAEGLAPHGTVQVGFRQSTGIPLLPIPPDYGIRIAALNIDVNDQFKTIFCAVRRWPNRPARVKFRHPTIF